MNTSHRHFTRLFAGTYADRIGSGSRDIGRNERIDEVPRSFDEHNLVCQAAIQ